MRGDDQVAAQDEFAAGVFLADVFLADSTFVIL